MKPLTEWTLHVITPPSSSSALRFLETDFGDSERHYSVVAEVRHIDELTIGQNVEFARALGQVPRLVSLDLVVRELVPLLEEAGVFNLYVAPQGSHHRKLCTPEQTRISDLLEHLKALSRESLDTVCRSEYISHQG